MRASSAGNVVNIFLYRPISSLWAEVLKSWVQNRESKTILESRIQNRKRFSSPEPRIDLDSGLSTSVDNNEDVSTLLPLDPTLAPTSLTGFCTDGSG